MGFAPLAAGGLLGSQLFKKKDKPQGSLVNQYGAGGGKPTSLISGASSSRTLY